jgi:hypothetical protein
MNTEQFAYSITVGVQYIFSKTTYQIHKCTNMRHANKFANLAEVFSRLFSFVTV